VAVVQSGSEGEGRRGSGENGGRATAGLRVDGAVGPGDTGVEGWGNPNTIGPLATCDSPEHGLGEPTSAF